MRDNKRMRLSPFTWGIGIYAVLSLLWSGFVIYGVSSGIIPRLVELLILLILSTSAGRALRMRNWKDILPYSFVWGIEAALLDAIYTVPFSGWALYQNIFLWFGYMIVVIVPLAAVIFRKEPELPAHLTS